jgi:hypothetical protein
MFLHAGVVGFLTLTYALCLMHKISRNALDCKVDHLFNIKRLRLHWRIIFGVSSC